MPTRHSGIAVLWLFSRRLETDVWKPKGRGEITQLSLGRILIQKSYGLDKEGGLKRCVCVSIDLTF